MDNLLDDVIPHKGLGSSPLVRVFLPVALNVAAVGLALYVVKSVIANDLPFTLTKASVGGRTLYLTPAERDVAKSIVEPNDIKTTFSDVGGLDSAKETLLQHVVWPFKHSHQLSRNSIRSHPKGILLYGPPGSGKTLMSRALAKELGCSFINVKADMIFSKWVGETEKHVTAIFSLARKLQPTVVFVDEIDSILSTRNDCDNAVVAHSKALFMTEWDGLEKETDCRIIVVGATNRRLSIDEAILRRLPLQVKIELPDFETRKKILQILLAHDIQEGSQKDKLVAFVAERTDLYSGSDLEELCKAAALLPFQEMSPAGEAPTDELPEITEAHFLTALKRVQGYQAARQATF
eukprot:gene5531-3989_t